MSTAPNALARTLRRFFAEHLPAVRGASPHTVLSYRDALALFLRFLADRAARPVVDLDLGDLQPDAVVAFLDHLEHERGNRIVTRNARLAALHAFARYLATQDPEWIAISQQILAVPFKRAPIATVEYLEANEIRALFDATDCHTPTGRRDHTLLLTLFNTGARVQELLDLRPIDVCFDRPRQVRLRGKGRKERLCPLWPKTVDRLRQLLEESDFDAASNERLFRNRRGEPLTRFGVRYLLNKYAKLAVPAAPTLASKRVHPHTMRHTTAVHLLQAGVDMITISHWLGHASVETTNRYAAVDLDTKRAAIAKVEPVIEGTTLAAWRTDSSILDWLEAL